jgi:hypothetical protein
MALRWAKNPATRPTAIAMIFGVGHKNAVRIPCVAERTGCWRLSGRTLLEPGRRSPPAERLRLPALRLPFRVQALRFPAQVRPLPSPIPVRPLRCFRSVSPGSPSPFWRGVPWRSSLGDGGELRASVGDVPTESGRATGRVLRLAGKARESAAAYRWVRRPDGTREPASAPGDAARGSPRRRARPATGAGRHILPPARHIGRARGRRRRRSLRSPCP